MQPTESSKQRLNELLKNYGPLGPRHLLAAAMMLQAGKKAKEAEQHAQPKAPAKAA